MMHCDYCEFNGQSECQHERRERIVQRACRVMGWKYEQDLVFKGLKKTIDGTAVVIALTRLEEMLDRIGATNERIT